MSSGTRDGHGVRRWPEDPRARAILEEWWRGDPEAHLYATAEDFRGADLSGLSFYHFFGDECVFAGTRLRSTSFGGAYLPDCDFSGADLHDARFPKAQINGTRFDRASMTEANLIKVEAEATSFVGSDLTMAQIGGRLDRTDFTRAIMRETHFIGASLRGALLTDAVVAGSNGDVAGPIRVRRENGEETLLGRDDTEAWFRARGAEVTVRELTG